MTEILTQDRVRIVIEETDRETAIRAAGIQLRDAGAATSAYLDAMLMREQLASTYAGNFLALPAGTPEAIAEVILPAIAVSRYEDPIDWGGQPVRFVVGIAGVGDSQQRILDQLAPVFSGTSSIERLTAAADSTELFALLCGVNVS